MDVRVLLREMADRGASDLYLTVDSPPVFRIEGVNHPLPGERLDASDVETLANSLMTEKQRMAFEEVMEMNLAISSSRLGRYRVNVLRQRGNVAVVIRQIKTTIPTLDELGLPEIFKPIVMTKRGLVLVTGATGSGKSTTMAAMLDYRNANTAGHIISIEDPIEFIHPHQKSIVTQREVGFDTNSYGDALKNALRQAPDVIVIGEIRDRETMEAAITFADTGHLCIATLHSTNANQTLERIMNFFPGDRHSEMFLQLSMNLRSIVAQRLIRGVDDMRVAVHEILIDTAWTKDLIKRGEIDTIKEAIERSVQEGGQTFDQGILKLYSAGVISEAEALANADSENNLRIQMKSHNLRESTAKPALPKRPTRPGAGGFRIAGSGQTPGR